MNCKIYFILFFLMLLCAISNGAQITVSNGTYFGQQALYIHNSYATLCVLPKLGGRLISFSLRNEPDSETLYTARHNIHFAPDDQWKGSNYGGVSDVDAPGWPGHFWGTPYEVKINRNKGRIALSAQTNDLETTRHLTFLPGSTILQVDIEQTSIASVTKQSAIRLHAEHAVGRAADTNDTIYLRNQKGLVAIPYKPGWENPRFSHENPTEGWMAFVDALSEIAMVRLFKNPDEDIQVLVWHGHNEGGPVRDKLGGFYAADRLFKPTTLSPGASLHAAEEFYIIKGLERIDAVHDYTACAFTMDRDVYAEGMTAHFTVAVGSAKEAGPFYIRFDYGGKEQVKQTHLISPGKTAKISFDAIVTNSTCPLIRIANKTKQIIATISRPIEIDNEGYIAAQKKLNQVQGLYDQILAFNKKEGATNKAPAAAVLVLAEKHLQLMQEKITAGHLAWIEEHSEDIIHELSAVCAGMKNEEETDPSDQKKIQSMLNQLTPPDRPPRSM